MLRSRILNFGLDMPLPSLPKKGFLFLCLHLSLLCTATQGQQYNLTGSSEFAVLGEAFTWTCEMFIPPVQTINAVSYIRNSIMCGSVGHLNGLCRTEIVTSGYTFGCTSIYAYTLTIPAENMTEYEQGSVWRCEYFADGRFRSPDVTMRIAIDVHNVSLVPSDNLLTLKEGVQRELRCVFNSNAVPAPTITWYLGSTEITSTAGTNTTSIIIAGNRADNRKMLRCSATNNKQPPKTAFTTLNVEYAPIVYPLTQQYIVEGRYLSVTCLCNPGNPSSTTLFWTKVDITEFKQSRSTLQLPTIQRNRSGTYRCTAENTYTNGEKGTHSQDMVVNVLFPPSVLPLTNQIIIEGRDLVVTCQATPGNPHRTTFFWTSIDDPGFSQNGHTLQISNIQRNSSGTYRCTAENNYSIGGKGTHSQDMVVNVLYSPSVSSLSQQNIVEGRDLSVTCRATPGNPNSTFFFWTSVNDPRFRHNGSTLQLFNIQRNSSGTYNCTAENTYSSGEKGTDSQYMVVNVLYKPVIKNKTRSIVNETERVELTQEIDSNPLSDIAWYDGAELLKTQTSVKIAILTIEHASCADTKNFTLSVSNIVQRNVTSTVELIVNCKPKPKDNEITFIVTSATRRVTLSTSLNAYPRPRYNLKYENGTTNNEMIVSLYENAVNSFTIQCEQQLVKDIGSVTYVLEIENHLGISTIFVRILKQGKPRPPTTIEAVCEVSSARIKWKSSFDGGAVLSFFVVALADSRHPAVSDTVADKGENQSHQTDLLFLQPSVFYTFFVFAKNSYGLIVSDALNCTTLEETQHTSNSSHQTGLVVGIVVGVLFLLAIAIVLSCVVYRHFTLSCVKGLQKRRDSHGKTDDLVEEKTLYTVMSEQREETERNPYDVLKPSESSNQYESIQMRENQGDIANTYESLNKTGNTHSFDEENKDSYTPDTCISKNTEAVPFSNTSEEYINTSIKN